MSDVTDPAQLLGRRIEFHDASRRYPLRHAAPQLLAEMPFEALEPVSRIWAMPAFLNQGIRLVDVGDWDPSACTGFSRAHALLADPVSRNATAVDAFMLYRAAQRRDQWPETPPAEGSSVVAAAEAAVDLAWVESFWWAFTRDELVKSIPHVGPGVAGSWWTSGMFNPDSRGFVQTTGSDEGGHAYCLIGTVIELNAAVIAQTWGPWSNITDTRVADLLVLHGLPREQHQFVGLVDLDELWALLQRDGEYCVSLDVALEPLPEPEPVTPIEPEPNVPAPGCFSRESLRRLWRRR